MRFLRRSFCSTNLATSSRAKTFPVGVEHALDLVRWAREEETQRRETRRVESRRCQDFPLHQHAFIARPGKEREENPTRHLAGNKASSDYVLGRLLGLDVGTSRVGVAVTDASFTFAIPLGAIDRVPQRILQKQQRQLQQRSAINYGGHGRTRTSRYGEIAIGSFAAQLEALARRYRCCGCVVGCMDACMRASGTWAFSRLVGLVGWWVGRMVGLVGWWCGRFGRFGRLVGLVGWWFGRFGSLVDVDAFAGVSAGVGASFPHPRNVSTHTRTRVTYPRPHPHTHTPTHPHTHTPTRPHTHACTRVGAHLAGLPPPRPPPVRHDDALSRAGLDRRLVPQ